MFRSAFKILLSFGVWAVVLTTSLSSEIAENLTETDEAEFRQGGIAQQLMPSYPAMGMGGIYSGNTGGFQYMGNAAASGTGNGGYVNMIRNLYRPSSLGLTDKVRHWVKSFMNRRQYVKPYYNPSMGGLSYAPSEFGSKPMFAGANGYKAISVPLRQLQKYYKPYYATSEGGSAQYLQSAGGAAPGSAAASSFVNYSPSAGGVSGNSGLYASESASNGHFAGGSGGLYGSSSDGSSSLFGAGAGSSSLFASGNSPSSLFSSGGVSGGGHFGSQGGSSGIFSSSDGSNSGLFSGPGGLSGGSLYGASGSPSSGLYHGSSGGAYSVDGGNSGIYGSDGSNPFFGASSGSSSYGSNAAAASSLLASLNGGGSSGGSYGDLYASGANPSASLYNPSSGDNTRGYSGSNNNGQKYGASSSALYMPSSEDRNTDTYASKSSKELTNSFNVDTSRNNNQAEASYSVSFQPAQSKSFSSSYDSAGFQPVSFSSESGNAPAFQEKSS